MSKDLVPTNNDTELLPPSKRVEINMEILQLSQDPTKFDEAAKQRALLALSVFGTVTKACQAAGVCLQTILNHRKKDKEFAQAWEEAKQIFKDQLEMKAYELAVEGIPMPIIGGKDRDEIITWVKKYEPRLIELILKRHIEDYRDQSKVDHNVSGGVLVVNARPSQEEFLRRAEEAANQRAIDVTPEKDPS